MTLLPRLVQSIAQTLTTRLVAENRMQGCVTAGPSMQLEISPALLASIIDELSRNTAHTLTADYDLLAEVLVLLQGFCQLEDQKAFAFPARQALVKRATEILGGGIALVPTDA